GRFVDQVLDGLVAPVAVEHAVEQVDLAFFLVQEMEELQATHVAVLEGRQRLEENDRTGIAVAVEQSEAAARLLGKRRTDQRHDGGDSPAAGAGDLMPPAAGIEAGRE